MPKIGIASFSILVDTEDVEALNKTLLRMCAEFFNALFQSFGNFDALNASIPKPLRRDPESERNSGSFNKVRATTIRTIQLILDGVLLNVEMGWKVSAQMRRSGAIPKYTPVFRLTTTRL